MVVSDMSTTKPLIGIIGAGMGGLTAAALLRKAGMNVRVFEQASRFAKVGAGIQQTANAMKVLRAIGLEEPLRQAAHSPASGRSRDYATGEITNEVPGGAALEKKYGAPYLLMHRATLHEHLAGVVPADILSLGRKLVGIEHGPSRVKLAFADGSREEVDALIAADGTHSLVREAMLGKEEPRFTGRVAYRTTFPASRLPRDVVGPSRTKWWGPDRHIVIYYITRSQDEVYFVTSQPEDAGWMTPESWSSKGDVNVLRDAYKDFHPDVRAVLDACPEVYKWALLTRDPLPRWTEGRVALLGDACHPMAPYMAQGAAMAIEDAAILSRCLKDVEPEGLADALKRYELNRRDRATEVQQMSNENTWLRYKTNTDWLFGYDAWEVPLSQLGEAPPPVYPAEEAA
jgi:salicylate hydroxylase/6-hydroxynicotinate 3-monooxygenase